MSDKFNNSENSELGNKLKGKYLTFTLSDEEYGVQILRVQEIIHMQKVTPIPDSPAYVRGVINLRGKVIPVIELRKKFNMTSIEDTEKTAIIIMYVTQGDGEITVGIIIDDVKEVLDVHAEHIEKTPNLGHSIDMNAVMGICNVKNSIKILLDIDKVFSKASEIQLNLSDTQL